MSTPKPSWRIQGHIDEAKANYDRYELMLEKPENVSWGAVFLFYAAIHLIQARAHQHTPEDIPVDHEDRRDYVAHYLPANIAENYYTLDDVSMQVRYQLKGKTLAQVRALHDDHFAKIRRYLREQEGIAWQSPNSAASSQQGDVTP